MTSQPTTRDVLEQVATERARLLAAIDALGDSAASATVTDEGWTARDVLAHLIHYVGQIAWALGARLEPPAYLATVKGRPSGTKWNAIVVDYYASASLAAVRAEFEGLVDALIERLETYPDASMAEPAPVVAVRRRGHLPPLAPPREGNRRRGAWRLARFDREDVAPA